MIDRLERPQLTDVTLVAVSSVALQPTVDALHASMRQVDFAEVLLLSDEAPPEIDPAITWRRIDRLATRADYSQFMLQGLAGHIWTSHALCVQWDGFVLNGSSWQAEFLEYDYIGAIWPHFSDQYNVGNGGFSLRSRRLLDACQNLEFDPHDGEDVIICRLQRPRLESQGLRFAPEEVARRFSYERTQASGKEFGFHGVFNLVELVSRGHALDLLRRLEPGMLARSERWELLRWALAHGQLRLATAILNRLVQPKLSR